jgi:ADP-heptose:LPS heptosyltransferase
MKYLILNPFGVGDVLFATPLVRILKQNNSKNFVGFICNRRVASVLETNPHIDQLFIFEKDEWRALWRQSKFKFIQKLFSFLGELRKHHFDVAIDLSMNSQYNFFLRFLGIPKRAGLDYKNRGRALTHRVPMEGFDDKAIAEYYLDTIRILNIPTFPAGVEVFLKPEDFKAVDYFLAEKNFKSEHILVGILPGGGVSFGQAKKHFKRWDIDRFVTLTLKLIQDPRVRVMVSCAPDEDDLAEAFKPHVGNAIWMAPATNLRESAALMKRCQVVVANDAGPLHLAVGVGVPTVSIFGPTNEKVYGPYSTQPIHRIVTQDIHCRPCYKRFRLADCDHRNCLAHLHEDKVLEQVFKALEPEKISA